VKSIGVDFASSRSLLILGGWVMAVSNFFNRTVELLKKKYN